MSTLSQDLLARTHSISIDDAKTLISNFKTKKTEIENGSFKDSSPLLNSESFNKDALLKVLNQENCIGIRFYFGLNTENKIILVGTGIDTDGNDLNLSLTSTSTQHELLQDGQPCPNWCPDKSKINCF